MVAQTAPTMKVRYATFHDASGIAIRTTDRQVVFVHHNFCGQVLGNADVPFLVLLGDVNTAEAQHLADVLNGGAAAIACTREV